MLLHPVNVIFCISSMSDSEIAVFSACGLTSRRRSSEQPQDPCVKRCTCCLRSIRKLQDQLAQCRLHFLLGWRSVLAHAFPLSCKQTSRQGGPSCLQTNPRTSAETLRGTTNRVGVAEDVDRPEDLEFRTDECHAGKLFEFHFGSSLSSRPF